MGRFGWEATAALGETADRQGATPSSFRPRSEHRCLQAPHRGRQSSHYLTIHPQSARQAAMLSHRTLVGHRTSELCNHVKVNLACIKHSRQTHCPWPRCRVRFRSFLHSGQTHQIIMDHMHVLSGFIRHQVLSHFQHVFLSFCLSGQSRETTRAVVLMQPSLPTPAYNNIFFRLGRGVLQLRIVCFALVNGDTI